MKTINNKKTSGRVSHLIKVDAHIDTLLKEACRHQGMTFTGFMQFCALEKAREILQKRDYDAEVLRVLKEEVA